MVIRHRALTSDIVLKCQYQCVGIVSEGNRENNSLVCVNDQSEDLESRAGRHLIKTDVRADNDHVQAGPR